MIIKGDIKPKQTITKNTETNIFDFSNASSLIHSFNNECSPLTIITRNISGRPFYINDKRIYFYDKTYAWGYADPRSTNEESVRLDLTIPFDLTT